MPTRVHQNPSWEGEDDTTNLVPFEQNWDMGPDTPLTYSYNRAENRLEGPLRLTAPDSQFSASLPLDIAWHEAPDPIRQSDFWAAGNKVNPGARMTITSQLAIPTKETIMEDQFHVGKLIGYFKKPMYAGGQQPSLIRANIREARPTTFGSLYEVSPLVDQPGQAYTSAGFEVHGISGDPYE